MTNKFVSIAAPDRKKVAICQEPHMHNLRGISMGLLYSIHSNESEIFLQHSGISVLVESREIGFEDSFKVIDLGLLEGRVFWCISPKKCFSRGFTCSSGT
jgi:hypothetical protein